MTELKLGIATDLTTLNQFAHRDTEQLWISSAVLTKQGLDVLQPLLSCTRDVRIVVGVGPYTDPRQIRALDDRGVDVRVVAHEPEAQFNVNCYAGVRRNGKAWAAIGTSTLARQSAGANLELMVTAIGDRSHEFFGELFAWLNRLHASTPSLNPSDYRILQEVHQVLVGPNLAVHEIGVTATERGLRRRSLSVSEVMAKFRGDQLIGHIKDMDIFASYKLIIIALLLRTSDGFLTLRDCAERFHAFYKALWDAGVQPERSTGNPPPLMLTPYQYSLGEVEDLILKEPKKAFEHGDPIVVFSGRGKQTTISFFNPIWHALRPELKERALHTVEERLAEYYERYTGSSHKAVELFRRLIAQR